MTANKGEDKHTDHITGSSTSTAMSSPSSWVDKANEQAASEKRDQPWQTTLDQVVDTNPAGKDLVRMGDDTEMQHSGT